MHPELQVPFVGVLHAYPVALAGVCLVGGAGAVWSIRRRCAVPIAPAVASVGALLAAAVIGARLHYALAHPQLWSEQGPLAVLLGGRMHIGGGVLACALLVPLVAPYLGIAPLGLADALAPAAAWIFGGVRIACLLHGCCFGRPGAWLWCFGYPHGSAPFAHFVDAGLVSPDATRTMPLHPLPLYFVAAGIALSATAAWGQYRRRFDGEVALWTLAGISAAMAALEPLRADVPGRVYWGPWPQLLWVAVAMAAVSAATVIWAEWRWARRHPGP